MKDSESNRVTGYNLMNSSRTWDSEGLCVVSFIFEKDLGRSLKELRAVEVGKECFSPPIVPIGATLGASARKSFRRLLK